MEVKVSVVVPCYNVEKYVAQCVESICAQTLQEIEIICVNDGSKDGTLAILQDFAAKDDRVRIIDKPNSGYGQSVNMGMASAKGKYIGIVESDDFIEPEMYAELYLAAEQNTLDVARCCYYEYHTSDNSNRINSFDFVPKNVVFCPMKDNRAPFWQQPTVWINLYRRDWLEENDIKFLETPGASYQDIAFSFKVYCCAKRFMMLEKAYLHYRVDNENSSINSKGKVFCVCDEWNEVKRFIKEKKIYESVKYMIPRVQLANYKWNYNRLEKPFKYEFLKVWSSELRTYIFERTLKWKDLSKKDRRHIFIIAFLPFIYKNRTRNI